MLDFIESLVRKSLILAEHHGHTTRYRVLETIRQFGEERLAANGTLADVRDRHARFYSEGTMRYWETWDGPGQRAALDWVDTEFANLRTAFRWAIERADLVTATAIASHAAIMVWPIQRFEPVSWALEIVDRAAEADPPQLPRLYVAASLCLYLGQPDLGVSYAQTATALGTDARYDPFENGWSEMLEALAHLFGGRIERRVEISSELATRSGFARVVGLCGLTWALPAAGRAEDAIGIADEALNAAREYGSPFWIGWALGGYGRAFAECDPVRALAALREGICYARENRLGFWEANLAQDAARLEASHGELDDALALFTTSIDSFHRAGNIVFLAAALASLAVFFDRFGRAEVAATVYGASTRQASIGLVPNLGGGIAHLRSVLDEVRFGELVAIGAAMETAEAVRFAQEQIELIGRDLAP
jgi:tetratricopeptide (TPR) repeat protein